MWVVKYRSLVSDDGRWVEATELGEHRLKKDAEQAGHDGLTASYTWKAVPKQAVGGVNR